MRSRYDYKIIISKGKTKQKMLLFLSLGEFAIVLAFAIATFKLTGFFLSELFALVMAVGVGVSVSALFIEIPIDHLSVLDHIKLAYQYYVNKPHSFYFYREKIKESEEIDKDEFTQEIEEERFKATPTKTKKKKK